MKLQCVLKAQPAASDHAGVPHEEAQRESEMSVFKAQPASDEHAGVSHEKVRHDIEVNPQCVSKACFHSAYPQCVSAVRIHVVFPHCARQEKNETTETKPRQHRDNTEIKSRQSPHERGKTETKPTRDPGSSSSRSTLRAPGLPREHQPPLATQASRSHTHAHTRTHTLLCRNFSFGHLTPKLRSCFEIIWLGSSVRRPSRPESLKVLAGSP